MPASWGASDSHASDNPSDKTKALPQQCKRRGIRGMPSKKQERMDYGNLHNEIHRVRELYKDPTTRHCHEWTTREKGMIHLDWFHNPDLYYEWNPAETEDMEYMHRTSLMFAYSHLSKTVLQSLPIFCRFLPVYFSHCRFGIWQAILIIQRELEHDCIKIALVWQPHIQASSEINQNLSDSVLNSINSSKHLIRDSDLQFINDEIHFEELSTSPSVKLFPKSPKFAFPQRVIQMALSAYSEVPDISNPSNNKSFNTIPSFLKSEILLAVHFKTFEVRLYNLKNFINLSLYWLLLKCHSIGHPITNQRYNLDDVENLSQQLPFKSHMCLITNKFSTAYTSDDATTSLSGTVFDGFRQESISKVQGGRQMNNSTRPNGFAFAFSKVEKLQQILPTHLTLVVHPHTDYSASIHEEKNEFNIEKNNLEALNQQQNFNQFKPKNAGKILIWDIRNLLKINSAISTQPSAKQEMCLCLQGYFPIDCRPNDVSASIGFWTGDKLELPIFVTSDSGGYLRFWKIKEILKKDKERSLSCTKTACQVAQRVDKYPILSLAVNALHPEWIAFGGDTGRVKIYHAEAAMELTKMLSTLHESAIQITTPEIQDYTQINSPLNTFSFSKINSDATPHQMQECSIDAPNIKNSASYVNIKKLSQSAPSHPQLVLPSPLDVNAYEYQNWFHPVIKVRWINHSLIGCMYGEPFYNRESTNAGIIAVWDPGRDVYSSEDAVTASKYWHIRRGPDGEQDTQHHIYSRLVGLHGGHLHSVDGSTGCDFQYLPFQQLNILSIDSAHQLHWWKPHFCLFSDCDDEYIYQRLSGKSEGIEEQILLSQKELQIAYDFNSNTSKSIPRHVKQKLNSELDELRNDQQRLNHGKILKLDIQSLLASIRKQFSLSHDSRRHVDQLGAEMQILQSTLDVFPGQNCLKYNETVNNVFDEATTTMNEE